MKRFLSAAGIAVLAPLTAWQFFSAKTIESTEEPTQSSIKSESVAGQTPVPGQPRNVTAGRRETPKPFQASGARNRTSDALGLVSSGDSASALRLLKGITDEEPTNQKAFAEYAHLLAQTGALSEQVLEPLLSAVRLDPDDGEALALLNEQFEKANRIGDGIDFLKTMPDESASRLALGELLLKAGRPNEAAGFLEKYARTNRSTTVLSALGAAQLQSGDLEGSGATFKEVEALRQKDINEVIEQGRENPAEAARRMAWTQLDLANVQIEEGNLEAASKLVDAVLLRFPEDKFAIEMKKKLISNRGT